MLRFLPLLLAVIGAGGFILAYRADVQADGKPKHRVVAPAIASDRQAPPPPTAVPTNPPTPTPEPPVYQGNVSAMYLSGAGLRGQYVIERRDTFWDGGIERFAEPSHPSRIAWYDRFGQPGSRATNSLFAAHVDYVGYGRGPFYSLTSVPVGSTLTLVMDNGQEYYYTVNSVEIIHLANLDMNAVVYPGLASDRERVTLISCGGTFVPYPNGQGGEYSSRVILVAERVF